MRERKISSVKSTISKLEKDAGKCCGNAEVTKAKKDSFKRFREGSWKSKEREKKVNEQVVKDRWTSLYY